MMWPCFAGQLCGSHVGCWVQLEQNEQPMVCRLVKIMHTERRGTVMLICQFPDRSTRPIAVEPDVVVSRKPGVRMAHRRPSRLTEAANA